MCVDSPLQYSCGCIAELQIRRKCHYMSYHQGEADYVGTPYPAGYPCDAHASQIEGTETAPTMQNMNISDVFQSNSRQSQQRSYSPPTIKNVLVDYLDEDAQMCQQSEWNSQAHQRTLSSAFESASHDQPSTHHNPSRPTSQIENDRYINTAPATQSRNNRGSQVDTSAYLSRSPQNQRQHTSQVHTQAAPQYRTPRSAPRQQEQALPPVSTPEVTFIEAYHTMMNSINLVDQASERMNETHSGQADQYRFHPQTTHNPHQFNDPTQSTPRATPQPRSQPRPTFTCTVRNNASSRTPQNVRTVPVSYPPRSAPANPPPPYSTTRRIIISNPAPTATSPTDLDLALLDEAFFRDLEDLVRDPAYDPEAYGGRRR